MRTRSEEVGLVVVEIIKDRLSIVDDFRLLSVAFVRDELTIVFSLRIPING